MKAYILEDLCSYGSSIMRIFDSKEKGEAYINEVYPSYKEDMFELTEWRVE